MNLYRVCIMRGAKEAIIVRQAETAMAAIIDVLLLLKADIQAVAGIQIDLI